MTNLIILIYIGFHMKISYKGDYALKAILDLAYYYNTDTVIPLTVISSRQDIPVMFLEQIMLILKKAGYIGSKRGSGGGFFLLKSPKQITVGEIIRLIEGPVEPISCGKKDHDGSCGEENSCAFREVWMKVTEAISTIVDSVTFEDMMQRDKELKKSLNAHSYQI